MRASNIFTEATFASDQQKNVSDFFFSGHLASTTNAHAQVNRGMFYRTMFLQRFFVCGPLNVGTRGAHSIAGDVEPALRHKQVMLRRIAAITVEPAVKYSFV